MKEMSTITDRFIGCLYGQAIGDALGLGTEFLTKDEVKAYYPNGLTRYDQIVRDNHRRRWHEADWTDDTDMMLCIASALVKHRGKVDDNTLYDIACNFRDWMQSPDCMGIGRLVYNILSIDDYVEKPQEVAELFWNMSNRHNAPNGGIMRTSVVGLLRNKDDIEIAAANICKLTHYDPRCVGACVVASEIIHALVYEDKQLTTFEIKEICQRYDERMLAFIDLAKNSSDINELELDDEQTLGYTLKALSASLWCLFHCESFTDGLLTVVNAGGDADTNAAIACSMLGAKFGASEIPIYYKESLYKHIEYDGAINELVKVLLRG